MKDAKHELQVLGVGERSEVIRQPKEAARVFREMMDERREAFLAIFLDTRHRSLTSPYVISVGSVNASMVHPREVFRPAIEVGAAAIIIAHNHPSGSVSPSADDLELTDRLSKAGDILGIAVLDHLVISQGEEFLSIREYGWPGEGKS